MSRAGDMTGVIVEPKEVAKDLGFESLEQFQAWQAAGHPTGRCSNKRCWRPAFYPNLDKPCAHCGSLIEVDSASSPMTD